MNDESKRESERKSVADYLRKAIKFLNRVEDVNEPWGFVKEETLKKAKEAVWTMLTEINRNEVVKL